MSIMKYGLGLLSLDRWKIQQNPNGEYCAGVLMAFSLGRRKIDLEEMREVLPKRQKEDEVCILPWSNDDNHKRVYVETKQSSLTVLREAELMQRHHGESMEDYTNRRRLLNLSFMAKMQKLRQICLHPDLPLHMPSANHTGTPLGVTHIPWTPEFHLATHPWIRKRMLTLLLCLRQCFPPLYSQARRLLMRAFVGAENAIIQPSPKMMELLPYLDKKVIIFSTFKVFLIGILQPWLTQMGVPSLIFCGGPKKKQQETLETFNRDPDVRVLLLVKTAGAEGLNLQETCNVCIIMDPHFNMALDEQAAQRIDRIGQTKDVIVRRLFMEGSIDEALRIMQEEKHAGIKAWLGTSSERGVGKKSLESHGLFLRRYDTVGTF